MGTHVHIVCSNEARNGKTLFARLYADILSLSGAERVRVFDTDHPNGSLAHWFPGQSEIVDLNKTGGQVRLFDTIIGEPGYNYVIDLQAGLLERFFTIFHDIAFDEGAKEAGIGVAVFYLLDRSVSSIHKAAWVRSKLSCSDFAIVKNEALGTLLHMPSAAREYMEIPKDRDLNLPKLSAGARDFIQQPGFSFGRFLTGGAMDAPLELRLEITEFLERLYNQRKQGGSGTTLVI